jgi:hypothetical protein
MRRTPHFRLFLAALVAALAIAAASCGGSDGPSISAEPDPSTTSSFPIPDDTTTTTAAVTPTTPTTGATVPGQVTYRGLTFTVPTDWPVHDLANEPNTCARTDQHAVYLGEQGPDADCPSRIVGQTDAFQLEQIDARSQLAADRATQASTINGIPVRIDPSPAPDGALTVVFTDQQVVAVLTIGNGRSIVDQILASVALSK